MFHFDIPDSVDYLRGKFLYQIRGCRSCRKLRNMWRVLRKHAFLQNSSLINRSGAVMSRLAEDFSSLASSLRRSIHPSVPGFRNGCSEIGNRRYIYSIANLGDRGVGLYRRSAENLVYFSWSRTDDFRPKMSGTQGFASVAEAAPSTDDESSVVEEIQEDPEQCYGEVNGGEKENFCLRRRARRGNLGYARYRALRTRQVKIETEVWEKAAREYRELVTDMCKQKLAPNLPYMKSLFLGWFEPLRARIAAEQESYRKGKNRTAYAPYFDRLPAEMMAVITMHKLMGLLMMSDDHGTARVVQAACRIGDAVENEVCKFSSCIFDLMKKQKVRQVAQIVKRKDQSEPWGVEAHAKVGCRLIELLIETAYIQHPSDETVDGPPDIRPAFRHSLRNVSKDQQSISRRYGVIECDPLVRKGLDRTARHMVIPYMPMLVPPLGWTGYDQGAHLFLPSHIMRTHGSRQQPEAIKRTPTQQLQFIFKYIALYNVHEKGERVKLSPFQFFLLRSGKEPVSMPLVSSMVLEIVQGDYQKDPTTNPNAARARLLIGQVDRKLVKQTVMTSVYGVTYIGARDQIKRRLKERNAIPDDHVFRAACYAAKATLTALEEMFQAARDIMSWLGDCAKLIALENEPVRWTTPLGLPVVQPYRKKGRCLVKTSLQILALEKETDKVMAKRQRTAFPPNFVHSFDGSHMMMTAIACKKAGLSFAGVHDSYWTHACDVDELNRILREKFVELYEQPILEELLESFRKSFPHLRFPPLPDRGDFDLREVLKSPYFFN